MTRPAEPVQPQKKEAVISSNPKETFGVVSTAKNALSIATSPFKAGFSVLAFLAAAILYPVQYGINKAFGVNLQGSEWLWEKSKSLGKGAVSPFLWAPKMAFNQVENIRQGRDYTTNPVAVELESLANVADEQVTHDSLPGPSPDFEPISAAHLGAGRGAGRVAGA